MCLCQILGVWLTYCYRNQKDPRANPSAFLWDSQSSTDQHPITSSPNDLYGRSDLCILTDHCSKPDVFRFQELSYVWGAANMLPSAWHSCKIQIQLVHCEIKRRNADLLYNPEVFTQPGWELTLNTFLSFCFFYKTVDSTGSNNFTHFSAHWHYRFWCFTMCRNVNVWRAALFVTCRCFAYLRVSVCLWVFLCLLWICPFAWLCPLKCGLLYKKLQLSVSSSSEPLYWKPHYDTNLIKRISVFITCFLCLIHKTKVIHLQDQQPNEGRLGRLSDSPL